MEFPLRIIDAFIVNDQPFTGNPAAVCLLQFDDDISDDIKQRIASEINLSETAFVAKAWNKSGGQQINRYTLRWFTPTTEVELCGHATLAAAQAIYDECLKTPENNSIKFETKFKGILEAINSNDSDFTLDFPLNDCKPIDRNTNPFINQIIGYTLGPNLTVNHVRDVELSEGTNYLLISLKDSEDFLSKVCPDFNQLLRIDSNNLVKAVIVTQKSINDKTVDFYSRFFAPWLGVNEDPVTGSSYTVLTPYWIRRFNEIGSQTDQLVAKQCSKRGGIINCRKVGDRVRISGKTRTVVTGSIHL